MYLGWTVSEMTITETEISIDSEFLKRDVTITLLLPEANELSGPVNLLLLNDGQETVALQLKEMLEHLYDAGSMKPTAVAARTFVELIS